MRSERSDALEMIERCAKHQPDDISAEMTERLADELPSTAVVPVGDRGLEGHLEEPSIATETSS